MLGFEFSDLYIQCIYHCVHIPKLLEVVVCLRSIISFEYHTNSAKKKSKNYKKKRRLACLHIVTKHTKTKQLDKIILLPAKAMSTILEKVVLKYASLLLVVGETKITQDFLF